MGLDGQCGIFDELIILCVQYMYQRGTITGRSTGMYLVRYSLLVLRKMYSDTDTLVPCDMTHGAGSGRRARRVVAID